jgi:hypothetical protein
MIRQKSTFIYCDTFFFGQKFTESYTKSQLQSYRLCSFDLACLRRIFASQITHRVIGSALKVNVSKLNPNYAVRFVYEIQKPKEFGCSRKFRARKRSHHYGEHSKRARARIQRDFESE